MSKQVQKGVHNMSLEDKDASAQTSFKFDFESKPDTDASAAFNPAFAAAANAPGAAGAKIDYVAQLPAHIQPRVRELKKFYEEQAALLRLRDREMHEIAVKYDQLQAPLVEKRRQLVSGEADAPDSASSEAGIPQFWLTAFKNHPELLEMITEKDTECLKFLKDVTASILPDAEKKGFTLTFTFATNPFFTNTVLTKTYVMGDEDDMLEDIQGTKIEWHQDKNLTVQVVKKKKGKGKVVRKEEPCESFFRFFAPPNLSNVDPEDYDVADQIEMDFQLGMIIKQIVGSAVLWYTGEAAEELSEDEDDEDEDDEDEDEDDEDEDDDDEDDDDEDEAPKSKKGPAAKGKKGGAQGAVDPKKQEECKQQ